MKNRKKPDLLVILLAVLSLGVAASVVGEDILPADSILTAQQ
jgi:hypothetical protein